MFWVVKKSYELLGKISQLKVEDYRGICQTTSVKHNEKTIKNEEENNKYLYVYMYVNSQRENLYIITYLYRIIICNPNPFRIHVTIYIKNKGSKSEKELKN